MEYREWEKRIRAACAAAFPEKYGPGWLPYHCEDALDDLLKKSFPPWWAEKESSEP